MRDGILAQLAAGQKLSISGEDFVEASVSSLASLAAIPATALDLTSMLRNRRRVPSALSLRR